ncbi:MAG: hypothetical protein GX561_14905 [Lentisphaerae bacterium]|nr:hypothetical protein [Lentisphaerota bacterium]
MDNGPAKDIAERRSLLGSSRLTGTAPQLKPNIRRVAMDIHPITFSGFRVMNPPSLAVSSPRWCATKAWQYSWTQIDPANDATVDM